MQFGNSEMAAKVMASKNGAEFLGEIVRLSLAKKVNGRTMKKNKQSKQ